MQLALKLGLGVPVGRSSGTGFNAFSVLGAQNGFAIDFINNRMVVQDNVTPANNFDGDPQSKLEIYGTDPWLVDPEKGLDLSALRDFAIAMATDEFPYDPTAIHVYARYRLNAADSADQRYLFMIDNTGNDRFAMYTTSGVGFRLVTGSGSSADTELSGLTLAGDVEYQTAFGADAFGRSWVDDDGVQTNDQLHELSTSSPSHVGLGGYPNQVLRVLDGHLAEITVVCGDIALEKRLTLDPFQTLYGAEGDSHTFNVSFGLDPEEFYPSLIGDYAVRNAGGSGEGSALMLAQVNDFLAKGPPDVATIYAGSNDVDTEILASPVPSVTSFSVADPSKLAVGGWVLVNGESREVSALVADVITLAVPLSVAPSVADVVAIDTQENIQRWVQAVDAAGAGLIGVIGSHYLNFPSGGDTPSDEQTLRAACRITQQAAATAEGVPYVDTYAHMRGVILAGQVTQGDWAVWHQGIDNTHLTAAGEAALADAVRAALF